MSTIHIWAAEILVFAFLLTPISLFLLTGWKRRQTDFFEGLTDAAIKSYFHAFHPIVEQEGKSYRVQFEAYYKAQYGRLRFFWPTILFAGLAGLLLCWSSLSVPDLLLLGRPAAGKLPPLALFAVAGSLMWVLYDGITKWYASDITPADVCWWCFRMVIAIPIGYAVLSVLSPSVGAAVAFFLGILPTGELVSVIRRIGSKQLGFGDAKPGKLSELQELQGIDARSAEQFGAEGITTILQLAYCDPIRLTIRTGFSYSYIVDCTSQALLWIYVAEDIKNLKSSGLRGAYEVLVLYLALEEPTTQAKAEQVLREAAKAIQWPESSLRNMVEQVALDPYTIFLYLSWSGVAYEDLTDGQRSLLDDS